MKIYRRRYIPDEIVDISGDEVIYRDDKKLITKWLPINPREDFAKGESCVYFEHGWKISKFLYADGSLKYWYCDIINYEYFENEDKYIINDLLLDVIVYDDNTYKIMDEDELEEALKNGIISVDLANEAKTKLKALLEIIKDGRFKDYTF